MTQTARRPPIGTALVCASLVAASVPGLAATQPGLAGGRDLYGKNRWQEARAHLRQARSELKAEERSVARLLIGRTFVREAEFYRAVRWFEAETGREFMEELGQVKANRKVHWIPLFAGLNALDAGRNEDALQRLAHPPRGLPREWRSAARVRAAVAAHRLRRAKGARALREDKGPEGRYWRLEETHFIDVPETVPADASSRERLLWAAILFRAGQRREAEALLKDASLDAPDVEDASDPKKVLRFHDPVVIGAWERISWERAVAELRPLAVSGSGRPEQSLAAFYTARSLFALGGFAEAEAVLKRASPVTLGGQLGAVAHLLGEALSWSQRAPEPAALASLWRATKAHPEAVFMWHALQRPELAQAEPFATQLASRLDELPSRIKRSQRALAGSWGFVQFQRGAGDTKQLASILADFRNKANKNKLESNDPVLLLALAAADYKDHQYAQALETLFELSKTFSGLRGLQWNLQGIYAARQKAGGEARISQ